MVIPHDKHLFVTADWLSAHLSDDDIQLIDARMPPAGQENLRDIHAEFIASHLPGALFLILMPSPITRAHSLT